MKISIDTDNIVPVRAQIQLSKEMLAFAGINNLQEMMRQELAVAIANEMMKSGLIEFTIGVTNVEVTPVFKAETKVFLNDLKYITFEEFLKHAERDYKFDLAQYVIRPGEKTDMKDRFNQDLYIGNFVVIEDNGEIVYQMVLPGLTEKDIPRIGGFIYVGGEFEKFDINYTYADGLIPPRMEKVRSVKF